MKTALDKLVRIGQLKAEPRNDAELQRMLTMAQTRWVDAQLAHVLQEGRFTSAYNAAHAAALAALRWHGYRSENPFTVFQTGRSPEGGCWTPPTKRATSLNTKATWRSKKPNIAEMVALAAQLMPTCSH